MIASQQDLETKLRTHIGTFGLATTERVFQHILDQASLPFEIEPELRTQLYRNFFPNQFPTQKRTQKIFENCQNSDKDFQPVCEPCEHIFRKWIFAFYRSALMNVDERDNWINTKACEEALETFRKWKLPAKKLLTNSIPKPLWDEIMKLEYMSEKSFSLESTIWSSQVVELAEGKNAFVIAARIGNVIVRFHKPGFVSLFNYGRRHVNAVMLKSWLKNFGIEISLTTSTYLLEKGMPYKGETIDGETLFIESPNSVGVLGQLAYQLELMVAMSEDDSRKFLIDNDCLTPENYHPMCQSVVLALARLEWSLTAVLF